MVLGKLQYWIVWVRRPPSKRARFGCISGAQKSLRAQQCHLHAWCIMFFLIILRRIARNSAWVIAWSRKRLDSHATMSSALDKFRGLKYIRTLSNKRCVLCISICQLWQIKSLLEGLPWHWRLTNLHPRCTSKGTRPLQEKHPAAFESEYNIQLITGRGGLKAAKEPLLGFFVQDNSFFCRRHKFNGVYSLIFFFYGGDNATRKKNDDHVVVGGIGEAQRAGRDIRTTQPLKHACVCEFMEERW